MSAPAAGEPAAAITNRIDIPPTVRENLGITFASVEYRTVSRTRRVPGHFELVPEARRSYHSALVGQVDLKVAQYQVVAEGDLLFRVDSPSWREMQQSLLDTMRAIRTAKSQVDGLALRTAAVAEHEARQRDQHAVWAERLVELQDLANAGGGVKSAYAEARASLAQSATALAEVSEEKAVLLSERAVLEAELQAYREASPLLYSDALGEPAAKDARARDIALSRAAALLGLTVADLRAPDGNAQHPLPRWRVIDHVEVVARQAGVVNHIDVTNGAWIDVGQVVLTTIDPSRIRFRGAALQAEIGSLSDGLAAQVLPPGGRAAGHAQTLHGTLVIGTEADPLTRKIDILITPNDATRPSWARLGISTEAEVVLQSDEEPQMAIPVASVIQDGLEKVIFRRDPKDPNKVIRLPADLGISDGLWIVVESGVVEGDEVVHHGVYELMLASGSAKQEGGHFHSDGTFHAGPDH